MPGVPPFETFYMSFNITDSNGESLVLGDTITYAAGSTLKTAVLLSISLTVSADGVRTKARLEHNGSDGSKRRTSTIKNFTGRCFKVRPTEFIQG